MRALSALSLSLSPPARRLAKFDQEQFADYTNTIELHLSWYDVIYAFGITEAFQ